jgi:hypothetical protein
MVRKRKTRVDEKFLKYNKRNILTNLLQAEEHAKAMNTLSFIKGEGSCFLKHLLFVRGELSEIIAHSQAVGEASENVKIYEKIRSEIEKFLDKAESPRHRHTKRDLLMMVRKWRKEFEKTCSAYQTFNCACLHAIPYLKILLIFLAGVGFGFLLHILFKLLGL